MEKYRPEFVREGIWYTQYILTGQKLHPSAKVEHINTPQVIFFISYKLNLSQMTRDEEWEREESG